MVEIVEPDGSGRIGHAPGRSDRNNVIAFLERGRASFPDRTALLWATQPGGPHDAMTFGDLAERTAATAAGLEALGVRPGDRVFVFVPMSPPLYVAMFAVQRLGAIAVFLDSWARADQLASCVAQVEPSAFLAPEPVFALAREVGVIGDDAVCVVVGPHDGTYDASLEDLAACGEWCAVQPVRGDDTALVTFTTGSSGPAKGANRTHRFLAAQHRALDRCLPYRPDDVDLPVFPIFSLNNIAGGVTTVLPAVDLARPSDRDGAVLVEQLRATGATCCTLSPSLFRSVPQAATERGLRLDGLRRVVTGGAPVDREAVVAFRNVAPDAEIWILYGSTEVEPIAHVEASEMPDESEGDGVCVGRISDGLRWRLLRLHRGPVRLGERGWSEWEVAAAGPGELVVAGEHVCRDYFRNPDAFARSKIRDGDGEIWHRTGDVCRVDANGRLWVVGRVHNAISRAGQTLFPVGPERVMRRLPFVAAAGYVGLPDAELGERAVAAFSMRPGCAVADAAGAVRAALSEAGVVVDAVVEVDAVPLDPRHHSKVEYTKLRAALLARENAG
jgi:acyl-coenzyme A synthetase/AMP-(fatty) acid ligase